MLPSGSLEALPGSYPLSEDATALGREGVNEVGRDLAPLFGIGSYTAGVLTLVQASARIKFWDYQTRFDHKLGQHARAEVQARRRFVEPLGRLRHAGGHQVGVQGVQRAKVDAHCTVTVMGVR